MMTTLSHYPSLSPIVIGSCSGLYIYIYIYACLIK